MIKKLSERFFKWYCHPDYYEDIKGDLNELFHREVELSSLKRAEWLFSKEVLLLFRPSIIRPFQWQSINFLDMLQNYFKISFRNIKKHPSYSIIHILGLALGLTAFLFINEYINFEKSYDSFHYAPDQLYRLTTDDVLNGKIQVRDAMSFAPSGKVFQEEIPEVIAYTTTLKTWRMTLRQNGNPIQENNVIAVDSNFLKLFNYKVIKGDKETFFQDVSSIVLTESQAKKYFGDSDPMGQTIEVLDEFNREFEVTGVIEDIPENTHYHFDMLVSLQAFKRQIENDAWNGFNYYTYLLLDKNAKIEEVQAKLPELSKKYLGEKVRLCFNIHPVSNIHLHSDFTYEPQIQGSAKAVNFLSIISIFILLIAWVNYINLSTAKAMERAREVGLRKVVGARKRQLIGQFLFESLLINFFGAVVALTLAQMLFPHFNNLIGKTILTDIWSNLAFLKKLGLFFLLGTIITGFYPAIILSSFRPIGVLKGSFGRTKKGAFLRKALVIVQFSASLILIAATVIIYQQVGFMTNKDLGIDTEKVIGFNNPEIPQDEQEQFRSKFIAFTDELNQLSEVEKTGGISNLPGGGSADIGSIGGGVQIIGKTDLAESTIYQTSMNDQLLESLDIELLAGRNFNHEFASDTSAVILNESLLKLVNVTDPESVLNEYLQFGTNPENRKYLVAGVIKDYNRSTVKNNIEPTVYLHNETPMATVVKLKGNNLKEEIEQTQTVWNEFFPNAPFEYTFLDQRFEKLYQEDQKFGFIFFNFALLAILVASMGLFGLSSYLSLQRTKEVGIRKVLGASVTNIVLLFFKDFFRLIMLAVIIGLPIVYLSMNDWLSGYAYRINFPWAVLILAIVVVVGLAFFTVSFQTWKLALLNPSKTIRHE